MIYCILLIYPYFPNIILDNAENCKKFLPLIFGEIASFSCIELTIHQAVENLSGSGYTKVSGSLSTSFWVAGL
jgi:hypothetical protein